MCIIISWLLWDWWLCQWHDIDICNVCILMNSRIFASQYCVFISWYKDCDFESWYCYCILRVNSMYLLLSSLSITLSWSLQKTTYSVFHKWSQKHHIVSYWFCTFLFVNFLNDNVIAFFVRNCFIQKEILMRNYIILWYLLYYFIIMCKII